MTEKILFRKSSRREFFKKSGKAAFAIAGGLTFKILFDGCANTTFDEKEPVIFPNVGRSDQKKVQPPAYSCYFGIGSPHWAGYEQEVRFEYYGEKLGKVPSIINIWYGIVSWNHMFRIGSVAAENNDRRTAS